MSKISSVIDTEHILAVAQARCADHGVTVEFVMNASTASTNGSTIKIPTVKQPVTQAAMDKLHGYLIHECGHHLRPEVFKILKDAKPKPNLAALFNIVEDQAMEKDMSSRWRGDHIALSNANEILMSESADSMIPVFENPSPAIPWALNDNGPIVAMTLQQIARAKWDSHAEVPLASLIKAMPSEVKTLLDELINEGWHNKITTCDTVTDSWNTACDLCIRLYPDQEDEVEEARKAGNEGKEREGEETEGEGEGKAGAGKPGGPSDEDASTHKGKLHEGYNISWKDCVLSEHNEWKEPTEGGIGGIGITWEDYTGGNVCLAPRNTLNIVDLKKKKEEPKSGWGGVGPPESFMSNSESARALGNQIRRYIQSRARSQITRHKRHGRLDKASLVKLALPPIDKGDYNRKLFYSQEKRNVQDTAVTILVDWSGSMMGTKMTLAADSAGRLAHVLGKQIGIPVEVLAFSTRYSHCDVGVLKPFNERAVPPTEMARRFSAFFKYSSGNNDADAVAEAHRRLLKRKESRRVLIVLSDGAPTDTWKGGHADANLKYVTNYIERDKKNNIELWGVGILSDCVNRYYKQTQVLNDAESINSTLFAIVKNGYENYRRGQ